MNAPSPAPERLNLPARAVALLAIDGQELGGAVLRMGPGPEADEWLHALRHSLPAGTPWRRLPASIDDDRLLGGLDMTASLAAGRPLLATGLLVEAHGGVLILPMAERLGRGTAARIAAVIDRSAVQLERDGMTRTLPTRFCLLAFDEAREDETPLSPDLRDRLALQLSSRDFHGAQEPLSPLDTARVQAARRRLVDVGCTAEQLHTLCATAQALGIESLRPAWFAVRVARANAAWAGRDTVNDEDLMLAVRLVLAPRATQLPELPNEEEPEDTLEEPTPPEHRDDPETEPPDQAPPAPDTLPQELVLEAVRAALPPGLVASLTSAAARRQLRARVARGGPPARALRRGRPIGVMRGDPRKGYRLHLPATLKTAAPWQTLRRGKVPEDRAGTLQVRAEDFRVVRFKSRQPVTRIFVVDASGSAAAQRLAETKGAIELLLSESYVTRDQVALIAFRGTAAELILPPTRALARAKRELAGLPGGGGTPLAAGLHAAWELARDLERKGQHPVLILMTDGRANVCLDGSTGHEAAGEEALQAARQLRASGWDSLVVDTARRPRPKARALAEAMGARYLPLPQANSGGLSAAAAELETAS
jgi:magnesium chelatase subunit D